MRPHPEPQNLDTLEWLGALRSCLPDAPHSAPTVFHPAIPPSFACRRRCLLPLDPCWTRSPPSLRLRCGASTCCFNLFQPRACTATRAWDLGSKRGLWAAQPGGKSCAPGRDIVCSCAVARSHAAYHLVYRACVVTLGPFPPHQRRPHGLPPPTAGRVRTWRTLHCIGRLRRPSRAAGRTRARQSRERVLLPLPGPTSQQRGLSLRVHSLLRALLAPRAFALCVAGTPKPRRPPGFQSSTFTRGAAYCVATTRRLPIGYEPPHTQGGSVR